MLKPRSYTREDVVEVHCHGGSICVQRVLSLCLVRATCSLSLLCPDSLARRKRSGARLAQPGEFTMRAFLNGASAVQPAETALTPQFYRAPGPVASASRLRDAPFVTR